MIHFKTEILIGIQMYAYFAITPWHYGGEVVVLLWFCQCVHA